MSTGNILFCIKPKKCNYSNYFYTTDQIKLADQLEYKNLFLLSEKCSFPVFKYISRQFVISTRNGSSMFNIELLKNTSSVINDFLKENPSDLHYFLNINDEKNVLSKFEKLYQGMIVNFTEDDLQTSKQITKLLLIKNCPNFLKLDSLYSIDFYSEYDFPCDVIIDNNSFFKFVETKDLQTFTIITNKKEYKCNVFGVYSSNVIKKMLEEDSKIKQYQYNYDDENEEFQSICDLFNFEHVDITSKNMNSLKKIAEDLQINYIINQVNDFIKNNEEKIKIIEDQQIIIDSIDNLFYWLNHIDTISVKSVKDLISNSIWISNKENIHELAAYIIQVIKTDSLVHHEIADLLKQLKEENKSNCFNILMQLIIEKLITLSDDPLPLQFIYVLNKNGLFPEEEIPQKNRYILLDPEKLKFYYKQDFIDMYTSFIYNNYWEKDDKFYEKMIKNFDIDDKIINYIRYDDLDALQFAITKDQITIKQRESLINICAQFGSSKCFKYLLMNNEKVDKNTFLYAIDGGNLEIIKIIYEKLENEDIKDIFKFDFYSNESILISKSISKHRKELFDWILEQSIINDELDDRSFYKIASFSASQGDPYPIIKIIEKGFNISNDSYEKILKKAAKNGFYKIMQIILNLMKENSQNGQINFSDKINSESFISFRNMAIFEVYIKNINKSKIKDALMTAIANNQIEIIDCIFDNCVNQIFQLKRNFIIEMLQKSFTTNDDKCFNLIIQKLETLYPELNKILLSPNLLSEACENKHFFAAQKISNYIYIKNPEYDFTSYFITAVSSGANDICQFFIDKNVNINYESIILNIINYHKKLLINYEVFMTIYNNISLNSKDKCLKLLNKAIRAQNKKIIEFLFERKATSRNALINAVSTNDIEIVDLVLKYNSKPSFVNQIKHGNTALLLAVKNKNLAIVKRLLSIPGINPNLQNSNNEYPLISAIERCDLELVDAFLDFYGDDFISNTWIVSDVLLKLLELINNRSIILIKTSILSTYEINFWDIVKRIFSMESIDPNFSGDSTFLYSACIENNFEMVEYFLKFEQIDVNKYAKDSGQTPLIGAVRYHNSKIVELLINFPKTDINFRSFNKETALTIAVQHNMDDIVDLLINNERFNPKESRLNHAFKISNGEISKKLIALKDLDINHVFIQKNESNKENLTQTFLTISIEKNDSEKVDLILNHPSFNKERSKIIKALFVAVKKNNVRIFIKLFSLLDNDINISNENNEKLFEYALKNSSRDIITEIGKELEID